VQKFNAQYAEMRLLAYRSVPLSVPCVFWKVEVRELDYKLEVGELRFLASCGTLTTGYVVTWFEVEHHLCCRMQDSG